MTLTEDQKKAIQEEYDAWQDKQYAGKSKEERKELGQFYTPPELTVKMIEKFDTVKDKDILDPTCGAGGLLVACIICGADPKRVYGIELDSKIVDICRERLSKYGVPAKNIKVGNALDNDAYSFDEKEVKHDLNAIEVKVDSTSIILDVVKFPNVLVKSIKLDRNADTEKAYKVIEKLHKSGYWTISEQEVLELPAERHLKMTAAKIKSIAEKQRFNSFDDILAYDSSESPAPKQKAAKKQKVSEKHEYAPLQCENVIGRSFAELHEVVGLNASKSAVWRAWCEEAKAAYARLKDLRKSMTVDQYKAQHADYIAWKKQVISEYNVCFKSNMHI